MVEYNKLNEDYYQITPKPTSDMNNDKSNFFHLPYNCHACRLGDNIALIQMADGYPTRGAWIPLQISNPGSWRKCIDENLTSLNPDEKDEILAVLKSIVGDLEKSHIHTFKSGNTRITLIPSPLNQNEVHVFDHTRRTWVVFNWDTQWYNLRQLGLGCKPITIQREAHKAYGGIELFFKHTK